jgi:cytochrome b6-f complex iron-sulfur subunit
MKRYEFLKQFALGGSVLFAVPVILSSCSKDDDEPDSGQVPGPGNDVVIDLDAPAFSALKNVGGYAYQGDLIIIRSGESQYLAFSRLCTHQNCVVTYSHASGNLPCPCHGSVFSVTGSVITGPAPRALKKYNVTLSGTQLTIKA